MYNDLDRLVGTGVMQYSMPRAPILTEVTVQGPWHLTTCVSGTQTTVRDKIIVRVFSSVTTYFTRYLRKALDFFHSPARIDLDALARLKPLAGGAAIFPAIAFFPCPFPLSILTCKVLCAQSLVGTGVMQYTMLRAPILTEVTVQGPWHLTTCVSGTQTTHRDKIIVRVFSSVTT